MDKKYLKKKKWIHQVERHLLDKKVEKNESIGKKKTKKQTTTTKTLVVNFLTQWKEKGGLNQTQVF